MNHKLGQALRRPPTPHLNDERMAEIATAEAAGEDIAQGYPAEVAHLESCVACSEMYGALLEMLDGAVADMGFAVWQSAASFSDLLLAQLPAQPEWAAVVERVVEQLPIYFGDVPAGIAPETLAPLVPQPSQAIILAQTLNHNLAALANHLSGRAIAVWQGVWKVKTELSGRWSTIHLQLTSPPAIATLNAGQTGNKKRLFSQRVGYPIPFTINGQVEKISPFACQLQVRIDRPGIEELSGRSVEIRYGQAQHQNLTDLTGTAHFGPIPIAALPYLVVRIDTGR